MATPGVPSSGTQKSLDRIAAQLQAGAAYEAQQMYKTVYHRCRAKKANADAYAVLAAGAAAQLQHQQLTCGVELGLMLVGALAADKAPAAGQALDSVLAILAALPAPLQLPDGGAAELADAGRLAAAAVKWAHKQGAADAVAALHDAYASWVWRAFGWRQFGTAALHWSRGADAAGYAGALSALAAEAPAREAPLLAARAVLQTLACAHASSAERQLEHAGALLDACLRSQPALASAPLLRFCGLLLQALALHKHRLLALLQCHYGAALAADPSFEAYLAKIEATYFNVTPAGGGGGLLAGLLRGLLEGDEEEDE